MLLPEHIEYEGEANDIVGVGDTVSVYVSVFEQFVVVLVPTTLLVFVNVVVPEFTPVIFTVFVKAPVLQL